LATKFAAIGLVVDDAATIVITVPLGEPEGVEAVRPVVLPRLDHVDMGKEQQRLHFSRATVARHQIALERGGLEHLYILGSNPAANNRASMARAAAVLSPSG
jgi:hypothetical protein